MPHVTLPNGAQRSGFPRGARDVSFTEGRVHAPPPLSGALRTA